MSDDPKSPESSDAFEGSETTFEFDPEDWDDLESDEASSLLRGIEALVPGILKRSIVAGVSNALSEDGLRSVVGDKNIPKEAVGFVLSQADSTRKELLRIVSREVRLFLENMDFGGEIAKILTTLSFEVRTEIRFIPNDEAVRPSIRNRVKVKRNRPKGEDVDEGPEDAEAPTARKAPNPDSKGQRRWTRKRKRAEDEDE